MTSEDRMKLTMAAMLIIVMAEGIERLSKTETDISEEAMRIASDILRIAGEDEEATE